MQPVETAIPEPEANSRFHAVGEGPLILTDRVAAGQLEFHIREGVKAIRGHGVEIGGLVLGPAIDWNAAEVIITGFIPVQIEYRFGPTFRPSEADIDTLKEAAANGGGKVIGCFRSQLRYGLFIREEDRRLLAELFPETDSCFALVKADAHTPSTVYLHQVRAGAAPVLLDRFLLRENESGTPVAEHAQVTPEPPLPKNSLSPFTVPDAARKWKGVLWSLASVAAALAIAGAAYTVGQRAVPARGSLAGQAAALPPAPPNGSGIGLFVVERGPEVEIRWSPASPAIRTAMRGSLVVVDGAGSVRIDLNSAQVRSGLYVYKPVRNNLFVLITIYQADDTFTGATKNFTRRLRPSEPHPAEPQPNRLVSPTAKQSTTKELRDKGRTAQLPVGSAPPRPVAQPITPGGTEARESEIPVLTPVASSNEQALGLPEPAAAQVEPPAASTTAVSGPQLPSLPVPAPPRPGLNYQTASKRLVGPQIIHQAVPAIPLGVATRIRTAVQLEVQVAIDSDGKVSSAHVVSSTGAAGLLTIETLKAAQLCRFAPAQEDGHPVPSSMVLTFRFVPKPI